MLYGAARVQYTDTKRGIDVTRSVQVIVSFTSGPIPVDWERAEETPHPPETLTPPSASAAAPHQPLPPAALDKKRYAAWTKDFGQWVTRAQPLKVYTVPSMKLVSKPGESERDFQARIQLAGRETRDAAVEKLRERYAPKLARLQEKARKAEEAVGKEQQQASQQKLQTAVSIRRDDARRADGPTCGLALHAGPRDHGGPRRRPIGQGNPGRRQGSGAPAGSAGRTRRARRRTSARGRGARGRRRRVAIAVETIEIKPKRGGVDVRIVALAWKPVGG